MTPPYSSNVSLNSRFFRTTHGSTGGGSREWSAPEEPFTVLRLDHTGGPCRSCSHRSVGAGTRHDRCFDEPGRGLGRRDARSALPLVAGGPAQVSLRDQTGDRARAKSALGRFRLCSMPPTVL